QHLTAQAHLQRVDLTGVQFRFFQPGNQQAHLQRRFEFGGVFGVLCQTIRDGALAGQHSIEAFIEDNFVTAVTHEISDNIASMSNPARSNRLASARSARCCSALIALGCLPISLAIASVRWPSTKRRMSTCCWSSVRS